MLEKDIENLIAQHPDEFFPDSGFILVGQQVKLDNCYADIIFIDKYNRTIIVEVKRGILSREASGQITEYYGLLKTEQPDDFVELILCANIIPNERKKFLESVGIECKELGINILNQIAEKVGYKFIERPKKQSVVEDVRLPTTDKVWIFQANPQRYDIMNALADNEVTSNEVHWEINQHKSEIFKGHTALIWLSGKEAGIYAIAEILTDPEVMAENRAEKKYWIDIADQVGERLRVKMKILRNLLQNPITKEAIKNITGLRGLSILKQPRGTNFPVRVEEWNLIMRIIEK